MGTWEQWEAQTFPRVSTRNGVFSFTLGRGRGGKGQESVSNYLPYLHWAFARTEPLNY